MKRGVQAERVKEELNQSPYPVIVCGDFNDVPGSYTYETMRGNLRDAFVERGYGLGRSYNFLAPTLRIDYIFFNDSVLHAIGFRSPRTKLSDHNPVIANFEVR